MKEEARDQASPVASAPGRSKRPRESESPFRAMSPARGETAADAPSSRTVTAPHRARSEYDTDYASHDRRQSSDSHYPDPNVNDAVTVGEFPWVRECPLPDATSV